MAPTSRQLELLALHSTGMTQAELAAEVFLCEDTIYMELAKLRKILGARNLYHAQALALAAGYLAVDGREGRLFVVERDFVAA